MSFKHLRKTVSVLIILAFFFTNINASYAAPGSKSLFKNKKVDYDKLSNERQDSLEKKQSIIKGEDAKEVQSQKKEAKKILSSHLEDISQIHIPQELGRITEVYNNASSSDKKSNLIVHIQDLHTNPEAELNLAKILELLLKDYNMSLVCSEGADGKVDTSSISSFPDSQAKERVSRIFIDSGELTGEEYLSITKYPELPIWGIEDRDIYFKNITGFNNIMKFSPDSQVFISQVKKAIAELKPRVYSKDLLDLDQKESEFSSQKLDTAKYIKYLLDSANMISSRDHSKNIDNILFERDTEGAESRTAKYKNIFLLKETMETEKTIDQLKIMNQSQNLLLNLQSTLQSRSLNNDLDGLMARANLFKDQKISPFSFYSYLKDLANKHLKENFASKYPEFNSFVDYLTKVNLLDSTKLFTELEDLNYEIKEAFSKTDEQETLVKADHNINFLESFFNLKVSNEDLDYYLNNKDSHEVAFFKDFFPKALKKYNINAFIDYNPLLIDSHLQELEDFYEIVKDRDIAMVTNSLSEIEKRSSKVSSLIAGGFHTKGITKLLREKGYSYIVVSPYSKTDIDEENYHFLLSGRRKPITDLIKKYLNLPEIVNRLAPSTLRVPLAYSETAKAFAEQITGAVGGERTAADLAKSMASLLGLDNHAALWAGFGDKGIAGLSPEPGVVVIPWGNKYLEIKANEVAIVSAERYNGNPVVNISAVYKNKEIPPIQWYTADKLPEAEGRVSLIDLYAKADEPGMSRILDAIEAGNIEAGDQVAPPSQVEMTFSEEKTFSLEYIAMVPGVKGGINETTPDDSKQRLPDKKLPLIPVEQFNFVPAGYDTAVESLNAIQAVQKKFQEITKEVSWLNVSSPRRVLEWMTQAINETPEGAGVFISIDMNADKLRASDGTYYLGEDAERFGSEQKDGFVRYQLAVEYYQLLATDFSRLVAIEHLFAKGDNEAWQGARGTAALEEINLDHDERFASLPVDSLAQWVSQAAKASVSTFQGSGFLHNAKTGPEIRVLRGTLDGAIRRKSLETGGKTKAAQYPSGSFRSSLKYEPKHTGMGTSGFRGRVDEMRDLEPYAIGRGFVNWLIKKDQLKTNEGNQLISGQKMALSGDFRDSSPEFMAAVLKAYEDLGVEAVFLGNMSTPNMAYYCETHGIAGIMITGSHTEGKYNGLKLYDIDGEVLNEADEVDGDKESDRREIMAQVDVERDQLYRQSAQESHFDNRGYFKQGVKPDVKALMVTGEAKRINEEGRSMYVQRYIDMFQGKRPFEGHAIVYWVHSTVVAREHIAILEALGMEVIRVGERGKDFIALDTENMTKDHLAYLREQVESLEKVCHAKQLSDGRIQIRIDRDAYKQLTEMGYVISEDMIGSDFILLGESSSDGDGDRSLVVDEKGRFWRGDVTGAIVAETLGAEYFVQSLTGNEDTVGYLQQRGVNFVTSSVGSPYHVFLIRQLLRLHSDAKIMGQEVNGGTFIGGNNFKVPIRLANGLEFELNIDELNTRDAALPMLIVFLRSVMDQNPVSELFEGNLDNYADNAGLIHEMPVIPGEKRTGVLMHQKYTPEGRYGLNIKQVVFNDEENTIEVTYRGAEARKETVTHSSDLGEKLLTLRKELQGFFSAERGFGAITQMAYGNLIDDGFVMWDSNGDRFHVRRSGNAPETRIYVYAANKNTKRAADIIKMATEPGGILREIEASVWKVEDVLNWLRGGRDQAVNAFKANPMLLQIHCSVQPYDWGDTNFIPALLEIDNKEGKPFAELWIGAHPLLPAKANVNRIEINLNDLISGAAEEILGKDVAVQFNKQLPYLLKVLAAGKMLSIQAHPNKKQAEAGFDKENAQGVSIKAINRNYKDANHKPELIAVVTDFYALNGFRPLEEIAGLLEDIEEFHDIMPDFRQRLNVAGQDEVRRKELIKELYARVMSKKIMRQKRVDEILGPLIERLSKQSFGKDDREFWVLKADEQYTKDGHIDRGIFSIFLLNFVHLSPGEAMYLKAGELHAYLEGVGMECMANSDNVLRGGLTPKYIDVSELLTILTFNSGKPDILQSREISETEALYDAPVKEFMLSIIEVSPGKVHKNTEFHSADALIVMEGEVEIKTKEHAIKLKKGETVIIPAMLGEYEITGQGKLYKASIPLEAATIAEKIKGANPAAASSL